MKDTWGAFFRSDKMIMVYLLMIMLGVTALIATHRNDPQNMSWAREECGTLIGALIMLITGVGRHNDPPPPGTTKQTTLQTTVQEADAEKT